MRARFRPIFRWIIERRFAKVVRTLMWLRIAWRDGTSAARIARLAGYAELDCFAASLRGYEKRSTTFILGSGESINELSDEHFERVRAGRSIGINAWAMHPFVADVYSFETGQDGAGPSEETLLVSAKLGRASVVRANPQFVFLRPTPPATVRNLVQVPRGVDSLPLMYGRANVITQSRDNLREDIRSILRLVMRGWAPSNVLLDNGASVIRLIWLSILQGAKNVVLLGIDLNKSAYFWERPSARSSLTLKQRGVLARPSGTPHNSLETIDRPFPTDFFIEELSGVLRDELGVQLWVGSTSSSLSRYLPVYFSAVPDDESSYVTDR